MLSDLLANDPKAAVPSNNWVELKRRIFLTVSNI